MRKYRTIDVGNGSERFDYTRPVKEFGESLTDKSHFVPASEAVKALRGIAPLSRDVVARAYDFPDGKDSGVPVPASRARGRDIAEISTAIHNDSKQISEGLKEGANIAKASRELDQALGRVVDGSKPSQA